MASRPEIKALVRWESAKPIRDAAKKELPKEFAGSYIISVSGLQLGGRGRDGVSGGEGGGPQGLEDRLKQGTQLERKGADPIAPEKVLLNQQAQVRYFVFPRGSQPIQASDKEVVFHISMGLMELKVKFALKDMAYQGQLAL